MGVSIDKDKLDGLYDRYNRRRYVHPDPLEFLYSYKTPEDLEIAAMVASSLAYGRVAQITASVSKVLDTMGASPFIFLSRSSNAMLYDAFEGFVHRFATGKTLSCLLIGIKRTVGRYGSLNACFLSGYRNEDETVFSGLRFFVHALTAACDQSPHHLMALPERGSACKRLNLFLRWMVRQDAVDPGGWRGIPASKLIIPLDTHMHAFGLKAGMTCRRQADMRTALEITAAFKKVAPEDPVRYDFVLTREGIWRTRGDAPRFFENPAKMPEKRGGD